MNWFSEAHDVFNQTFLFLFGLALSLIFEFRDAKSIQISFMMFFLLLENPIGSMCGIFTYHLVDFYGKCR